MTDTDIEITEKKAILNAIEDGLAEFILGSDFSESSEIQDDNVFFWPESQLPEGIEVGDSVHVSLELTNKEERQKEIQQRKEKELKYDEMRKLLEELVN